MGGEIPGLLDCVRGLAHAPANQARYALWERDLQREARNDFGPFYYIFPTPANTGGQIPYTLDLEPALWHHILGVDLEQVFTVPAAYLTYWLRCALYRAEHFHIDVPLTLAIDIDFSSVFVPSLFGTQVIYASDESPWIGPDRVWTSEHDFAQARLPDFYASGLSPLAHRFYEEIKELVGPDFRVHFVPWRKGPFALLTHLRGYTQLLYDLHDRPAFVHEMLAFVTTAMKEWFSAAKAFTGAAHFPPVMLGNDEVNTPTMSPAMFEEFVLPYESEVSRFLGGIDYWHSCGNTTRLAHQIARIPNVHMFDVGPWTDLSTAVEAYSAVPGACLMRRINPIERVIQAGDAQMRQPLSEVRELSTGRIPTMVMYDGLNYVNDWQTDLRRIHDLDATCHAILHAPEGVSQAGEKNCA